MERRSRSLESAAHPAAGVAAIHAADQLWVKAYNAGDADTVAGRYDEHEVLLPPGAPAASGRAATRAFLAKDIASSAKEGLTFSPGPKPDRGVCGDLGWASGTYMVKDKAGYVVDAGKYLSVSRKKGGKWLYVRDTWNSDGARAAAAARCGAEEIAQSAKAQSRQRRRDCRLRRYSLQSKAPHGLGRDVRRRDKGF
jgi:ketosteroid isomerase-like protein